jgi:argininosuccinate synthase
MRGKVAIFDFERAELVAYADTESVSYQKNLDFSADGNVMATTSESSRDKILLFRLAK